MHTSHRICSQLTRIGAFVLLSVMSSSGVGGTLPSTEIIALSQTWHYHDGMTNGVNAESPLEDYPLDSPGSRWYEPQFDVGSSDASIGAWSSGPGAFGVGGLTILDSSIQTVLFGVNDTITGENSVTTYLFRTSFELSVKQAQTKQLELQLFADDGGRLFLNGVEVLRTRLPIDSIHTDTPAAFNFPEFEFESYTIPTDGLLRPGTNTLAFELHNASVVSGDAGFGLQLSIALPEPGSLYGMLAGFFLVKLRHSGKSLNRASVSAWP
ncbi:MAG: hypothetical protein KDA60_00305 [Planctomycetales bacterium]|nr:hypothetical protein [Planctomycetales bacterium]